MNNQYFLKDKKALVYEWKSGEKGVYDGEYFVPISADPIWCYAKQTSQDKRYEAMAYGIDESRMFVFDYNAQIKPRGLVKYHDQYFEITRVDTTDDYKTEMFVYARDMTEAINGKVKPYGYNPEATE